MNPVQWLANFIISFFENPTNIEVAGSVIVSIIICFGFLILISVLIVGIVNMAVNK